MRDILLIAFVGVASLAALFRPFIGLLAFVFLGFFSPQSMSWTIGRVVPFSQMVGVGTIVGYILSSEPKRVPLQRETLILLALWLLFCATTIFAIKPVNAYDRLIYISKVLIIVFLCMSMVTSEKRLRSVIYVIALSIGYYGLKGGIFSVLSGGSYLVFGPEESWYYANNSIGLALSINLPILFYLQKMEERRWLMWVCRGMFFFSIIAIIFTYSRGAWLGMAMALILIFFRSRRKLLTVSIVLLLLIFTLPIVLNLLPQRLFHRVEDFTNWKVERSAQSRFWNWEMCRRVGAGNLMHGGGFDFYSFEVYEKYYPEFLEQFPGKLWSCHSVWFTIFGEHGLPGIILWIGLFSSCLYSIRDVRKYDGIRSGVNSATYYGPMLQTAIMTFLVAGTFLDAAYFEIVYYVIAFVIICRELLARESRLHSSELRTSS